MGKSNGAVLAAVLALIAGALGAAAVLKGGFYLDRHEGDTLHMVQMVLRMAGGEWPHLDFVTPIGVLAMAPIAWLVSLGLGVGHAMLWSQVLVAALALPAIWWVARSRFSGVWQYAFGALVLILILSLVHGETQRAASISMHYNRWAWAASFLALATAVLPAQRRGPAADGVVIGVALAVMALTKATYFAAFLPAILVALIGRRSWRTLLTGVIAGLAVMAAVTLAAGTPVFWLAYLRDLLTVAGSQVRPQPSASLGTVIGAPAYMAGSLALILSVIWLREAGRKLEGLVMLVLMPALFYVTYQNYGNDPQWLPFLGLMLVALLPAGEVRNDFGWNIGSALQGTAIAALALGAPSMINLAYSPFRHLANDPADYAALIPGAGRHEDLVTAKIRAYRVDAMVALDGPGSVYEAYWDESFREKQITEWRGETLDVCSIEVGTVAWFDSIAQSLKATGLTAGRTAFVADILNGFWLYGAFEPLKGNAPWYYGGLTGLQNADFLVVPLCPLSVAVRRQILDEIAEAGTPLTEVMRDSQVILYEIGG